ncbi:MAG: Gfo/Idh/MocA family oxidoreductase [Planctomycetaceae bacterium]|nr:Gfo/Idh/MocA family oxidoreductase [Planctomycetaceae bacterium]
MSKVVKIGVIGVGWPGCEHLKGYKSDTAAQVVALCDINTDLLAAKCKEYDVPQGFASYRKMLAQADLDAVSVAVPNDLHAPITIAALQAGKHVICEKPPARKVAEAQAMAAAAKKARKVLMYALCQRFTSAATTIHRYVESGELGEIYFGRAVYHRRRGIPLGTKSWFVDKSRAGGGALIDIGVHALDNAWWLMGCPRPVSVCGAAYTRFAHTVPAGVKYDVDDSAFALIRFANDAVLILEASWALNQRGGSAIQIAGTLGGAEVNPLTIFVERNGMQMDITPQPPANNPFADEVKHFVQCIQTRRQPIPCAAHGVTLMKMLNGVYDSQKTRREVRIS